MKRKLDPAVDGSIDVQSKRPMYIQIVDNLRSAITSGQYRSGSKLPSEAELVRKYGVSRMTVVKAMQNLQQEGLLTRRAGSGSFVSSSSGKDLPTYGLIIPDLGQTEIFEPICQGMSRSSDSSGHSLSWGHSPLENVDREERAVLLCQQYLAQGINGVFFAPLEFSSRRDQINGRILSMLKGARIPVVLLDRCVLDFPERSAYDVVGLDNRRAGYIVTSHLLKVGARHIAFLAEPNSAETVTDRIQGYREALFADGNGDMKGFVIREDGSDVASIEHVLKNNKIDAIQCANDHTAAKLMRTLITLGVRIPEDIRITGVDDVKYASLLPVPLTTFHQPCTDIGLAALAAMKERIANPYLPGRSISLNGHLVVRESCGVGLQL